MILIKFCLTPEANLLDFYNDLLITIIDGLLFVLKPMFGFPEVIAFII